MHARSETNGVPPAFTDAIVRRRGVSIVHTFNEGGELPSRHPRLGRRFKGL